MLTHVAPILDSKNGVVNVGQSKYILKSNGPSQISLEKWQASIKITFSWEMPLLGWPKMN